ncbi:MAG TPA: GNAT family N-acetyltransferase, partial [Devosia sp.]|nr:GNAT family N-acetyltransferase [Devosia sp.]
PMRSDLRRFYTPGVNPLFPTRDNFALYTVHHHGKLLGRIGSHLHPASNALYNTKTAYFAYFDCADNEEAANVLLNANEMWAKSRGCDTTAGNFNLTAMQQIGVMTGGFEHAPYVDQIYSPPHIARLLTEHGYQPYFPMRTYEVDLESFNPANLLGPKQQAILSSPDYQFAQVTRATIPQRLEDARLLLNNGFSQNPMFVPLTAEEFAFQAQELKWIIDPRITSVIHYKGEPAAIALVIPDLNPFIRATRSRLSWATPWHFLANRLNRSRALVVYASVREDLHAQGLMSAMMVKLLPAMRAAGYRQLGITWIWDENAGSNRLMQHLNATPLHRTHLFRKALVAQ